MEIIGKLGIGILGKELEAAAEAIAAKHGLSVKRGRGVYTNDSASLKMEFAIVGENGIAKTREATDFEFLADEFGLMPSDLGAVFTSRGTAYTLSGLKARSPKFPFVATRVSDGSPFKFTKSIVQSVIAARA